MTASWQDDSPLHVSRHQP